MRVNLPFSKVINLEKDYLDNTQASDWCPTPNDQDAELNHVAFLGETYIQLSPVLATHKNNTNEEHKYRPPLSLTEYALNPFSAIKRLHQFYCEENLDIVIDGDRVTVYLYYTGVDRGNRRRHDRVCWGNATYSRENEHTPSNRMLMAALGGILYGVESGLLSQYLVDN